MRYRIESYDVSVIGTSVLLYLPVPDMPWAKIEDWYGDDQDEKIRQYITESLRLVVDETACIVFCSSMQKANLVSAYVTQQAEVDQNVTIEFMIPTGKTVSSSDQFTIEMDWGDAPGEEVKTFDADMALQLQGIIGDEESESESEPISGNSQTEGEIERLRTLQDSYDALADGISVETGYGKSLLATAITSKGVTTSATDPLPTMAEKVSAIAQESYTIDGGEMYTKQLCGSLETPNYWNLYEVLANLLSDGRLVSYGGILLAEYYKGYDSLALAGAGAGGAYVVSDMENGQFKMYTEDTTHTWNDDLNGKGNRWVAYCFADEGHGFQITNTDTSPRSIHIGRHVGVIESLVNGRISEIVVPDGNMLDDFRTGTKTQNWARRVILRNMSDLQGTCVYNAPSTENVYIKTQSVGGNAIISANQQLKSFILIVDSGIASMQSNQWALQQGLSYPLSYLYIECVESITGPFGYQLVVNGDAIIKTKAILGEDSDGILRSCTTQKLYLPILEEAHAKNNIGAQAKLFGGGRGECNYLFIGYSENDKDRVVILGGSSSTQSSLVDIELKDGYKKNIDISNLSNVLTAANIALHMLDRLGTCTTETGQLTLKIGATNLATIQNDTTYSSYLTEATTTKGWAVIA